MSSSSTADAVPLPLSWGRLKEGATRYNVGGNDVAVIKRGESYRIYDYASGKITRPLTQAELSGIVEQMKNGGRTAEVIGRLSQGSSSSTATRSPFPYLGEGKAELDALALENIPEYKKLLETEREAVRETVRRALANGVSEEDAVLFGRIAAKSGMNVIVMTDAELKMQNTKSADDAWFDGRNTVYVNADADRSRTFSGLLGHEMWHKIFKTGKGKKLFMQAYDRLDESTRSKVEADYREDSKRRGLNEESIKEINRDEIAAAYAEEIFNSRDVWEFVLSEEPSFKDRVLSFFKGANKKYSFEPGMTKAAKKWLSEYKKLFNEVSAYNKGQNVAENVGASDGVRKIERLGRVVGNGAIEPNTIENGSYGNENGVSNNVRTTADNKKVVSDSGERYALKHIPKTDINYVSITINDIVGEGIDPSDSWGRKARVYLKKKFRGVVLPVGKTKTTYIRSEGINEYTNPAKEIDNDIYRQKMLAATELDNLLKAGKYIGWSRDDGRHPDVLRWMNYETNFLVEDSSGNKQVLKGIIRIKRISRGDCFYDITKIENITLGNIGQSIINYAAKSESDAFNNSIPDSEGKSNSFDEKSLDIPAEALEVLTENQATSLIERGITGDDLLNARDLAETILSIGGEITENGEAIVYHGTTAENAKRINSTKKMIGKEDGLFFSTKKDGIVLDYGETIVKAKIPIEKLILDDIFDDEAHLRLPVRRNAFTNVDVLQESKADDGSRSALKKGEKEYRDKVKAKADERVAKATAKAEARADRAIETKSAQLKAEYTTDKVFSQKSVKDGFDSVPEVKALPAKAREQIARDLWLELEASDAQDVRDTFILKYSVKLYDAIKNANYEAYSH